MATDNEVKEFVDEISDQLEEACYLMIFPNDDGYDIEVESDDANIAGVFATDSHNLKNARKVADSIELELKGSGIKVLKTRRAWQRYLMKLEQ